MAFAADKHGCFSWRKLGVCWDLMGFNVSTLMGSSGDYPEDCDNYRYNNGILPHNTSHMVVDSHTGN
jgi:hypothetical protein